MNLELKKAIDQISKDKGIDRDMLIDTLEIMLSAFLLKNFPNMLPIEKDAVDRKSVV